MAKKRAMKKSAKSMKKPARKPAARAAARRITKPMKKPASKTNKPMAKASPAKSSKPKNPWFDGSAKPLIAEYAQRTQSFIDAIADGKISENELKTQENRLIASMKEVEPMLDGALHDKVTKLLCEMAAYDFMQAMQGVQASRPVTEFRG
jgi:hypothetical protein